MSIYKNPYFLDAATKFFKLCDDSKLRKICRDRENRAFDIRCCQRVIKERDELIKKLNTQITEKNDQIAELDALTDAMDTQIAEMDTEIAEKRAEITRLKAALAKKGINIDNDIN